MDCDNEDTIGKAVLEAFLVGIAGTAGMFAGVALVGFVVKKASSLRNDD